MSTLYRVKGQICGYVAEQRMQGSRIEEEKGEKREEQDPGEEKRWSSPPRTCQCRRRFKLYTLSQTPV